MRAPASRKQTTINFDGQKVVIISSRITWHANHIGWRVIINGKKTKHETLTRREAEDAAFVLWVKSQENGR